MLTHKLLSDLREMARQYFSDHPAMRDAFEDEVSYAEITGAFKSGPLESVAFSELSATYNNMAIGFPGAALSEAKSRRKRLLAAIKEWAAQTAKEIAPTTDERYQPESAAPMPLVMTKAALIAEYEAVWPTIRADLNNASKPDGMSVARASQGGRGWDVQKALTWARSKGKLGQKKTVVSLAQMWPPKS